MRLFKRSLAAAELLLIFPATLFMTALFVRNIQPEQYQPAHTAALIVSWYAHGPVWLTLWIMLIAMPLAVLLLGASALLRDWRNDAELRQATRQTMTLVRAHFATLLVATATLAAGCILAIVAVHVLTD